MYYLLVYAQLVLLTPVVFKIINAGYGWVLWCITPVTLIVRELFAFWGTNASPIFSAFFGSWLIFYVMGIQWRDYAGAHSPKPKFAALAVALTLAMQVISAWLWNQSGNFVVATSQLKISAMLTSMAVMILSMSTPLAVRQSLGRCQLFTLMGDCSYGVYLCHFLVLVLIRKAFGIVGLPR